MKTTVVHHHQDELDFTAQVKTEENREIHHQLGAFSNTNLSFNLRINRTIEKIKDRTLARIGIMTIAVYSQRNIITTMKMDPPEMTKGAVQLKWQ